MLKNLHFKPELNSIEDIFGYFKPLIDRFIFNLNNGHPYVPTNIATESDAKRNLSDKSHQQFSDQIKYLLNNGAPPKVVINWVKTTLETLSELNPNFDLVKKIDTLDALFNSAPDYLATYKQLYEPLEEKKFLAQAINPASHHPNQSANSAKISESPITVASSLPSGLGTLWGTPSKIKHR